MGLDKNNSFTAKLYNIWLSNSFVDIDARSTEVALACAKFWMCDVSTKVAVLFQRRLVNWLPTRDALEHRGVILLNHNRCCVMCFRADESTNHLFYSSAFTEEVWEKIFSWLGISPLQC